MSIPSVDDFDRWIRDRFKAHNTRLETLYFEQADRADVASVGDDIKAQLRDEGAALIARVAAEPRLHADDARNYDLLGNVGLYMAAMRRHELTNPAREKRSPFPVASALAQRLAVGLGVAPRFATAHINLSNLAHGVEHKSFTRLDDELLFIEYNCLSILGYIRAADTLRRIGPLGVGHPVTLALLRDAQAALERVVAANAELDRRLDVDRFFYNVRPYFKPYRVGRTEYRGANAGDFAAINEVDLMLGLCGVKDAAYTSMLLEKLPFMPRQDQGLLQDACRQGSLLDGFIEATAAGPLHDGLRRNMAAFLDVCAAHGRIAAQHHDLFVRRFIEEPSTAMSGRHLAQITASGPPLQVLVGALEVLRDKRLAADRPGIESRFADIARLKAAALAS
ncbi:monodechloroaminopyrrolnitrin synthase PrnB family protein [Mitsuaria sp. GD03876]|uniref:monodechloroaminopyrrolnitrin synthase PrnB family protein n=1 Tax=Mitsuaria sp. GD03876 TaxID=2975399 RepID=UPI00244A2788|nr:monodechloroaminopyrrolnitrin synthase PrnB family protein [Mitsuaria sp. GD03876]MDH0865598.1 DUF1864 family protein [Mitsuaria sp. GD03876]